MATRPRRKDRSVSSRRPENRIPFVRTVVGAASAQSVMISPMSSSRNGSPPVRKISCTPSCAASLAIRRTRARPSGRRLALGEDRTQQ